LNGCYGNSGRQGVNLNNTVCPTPQNFALQPIKISKRKFPVKNNCALFAPTPYFGLGIFDGVIEISPLPTSVAMATNFGTKIDYNSARKR